MAFAASVALAALVSTAGLAGSSDFSLASTVAVFDGSAALAVFVSATGLIASSGFCLTSATDVGVFSASAGLLSVAAFTGSSVLDNSGVFFSG